MWRFFRCSAYSQQKRGSPTIPFDPNTDLRIRKQAHERTQRICLFLNNLQIGKRRQIIVAGGGPLLIASDATLTPLGFGAFVDFNGGDTQNHGKPGHLANHFSVRLGWDDRYERLNRQHHQFRFTDQDRRRHTDALGQQHLHRRNKHLGRSIKCGWYLLRAVFPDNSLTPSIRSAL
jgi:hypothetical protein